MYHTAIMNARHFVGWACTVLGALGFAASGCAKLISPGAMAPVFALFGLPAWTIPVVGSAEVVGVILALLPNALRRSGAGILGIVALGAFVEHESHGQYGMGIAPLLLGILVVIGVQLRTPSPSRTAASPQP